MTHGKGKKKKEKGRNRSTFSPFAFYVLVLMSGCRMFEGDTVPNDVGSPMAIYPDVPVMAGMTYVKDESFIYHRGDQRIVNLKYVGKARLLAAVQFYKSQMRAMKWGSPSGTGTDPVVMGSDPIRLFFKKGSELATVEIDSRLKGQTVLTIEIRDENTVSPIAPGDKKTR